MDQTHTPQFQCIVDVGLNDPSTTQGQCCASHPTGPPSIHGESILFMDFVDYCPVSGTCRFIHLSNCLMLTHNSRYSTSEESTLGSTFYLPLMVLVLIFFQIQPHCHWEDCTHPCLCAYWYIIPYLLFSWTSRRNSAIWASIFSLMHIHLFFPISCSALIYTP